MIYAPLAVSKKNNGTEHELSFIEPIIEFQLTENKADKKRIRILFDLEFRHKEADDDKEYYVDCDYSSIELKKIAAELENELEPYPVRAI